jgi:diguanylate cyclase (GGDEF)-like protein
MSDTDCDAMLDEIGRNTREVASLFEINIGKGESFEEVLKKANEALVTITEKGRRSVARGLSAQPAPSGAGPQPLIALADQAELEAFLAKHLSSATEPLSLVLVEPDRVKAATEKQAPAAAGMVIQSVAGLVRSAARPLDFVAQGGQGELALALPGTPRATAAAIAESIRRAITAKPLPFGNVHIPVTASVGVACIEPGGPLKDAGHLLKAATLALEAAKQAGRNCVRIFSLKSQSAAA